MGRLTVIGSGNAFSQDGRGNAALLVEREDGGPILVDVGPTALASWPEEVPVDRLDGVLITHLHGDHIAGWPFLLLHLRLLARRERPLPVVGPVGTAAALEGLSTICYGELLAPDGDTTPVTEWPIERARGRETPFGVEVDCEPVRHHPTSLAYRFRVGDVELAISGDTGWCDELERLAAGADVLVLECTSVEPQVDTHVSLRELRERRQRLAASRIVLTHLSDEVAHELALDPLPGVEVAWDGRVFDLSSPDATPAAD